MLKNITNITGFIRADKKSKSFDHYLILNISPFPCSFPVEYHIWVIQLSDERGRADFY